MSFWQRRVRDCRYEPATRELGFFLARAVGYAMVARNITEIDGVPIAECAADACALCAITGPASLQRAKARRGVNAVARLLHGAAKTDSAGAGEDVAKRALGEALAP
jgi:hypothetical protein